jgi:hypothetical protein
LIAVIQGIDTGDTKTLAAWYAEASSQLSGIAPSITFSGRCASASATVIPIPASLQAQIVLPNARALLFRNGLLQDPRYTQLNSTVTVVLAGGLRLIQDDLFTVIIKNIPTQNFDLADVVI